MKVIAGNCLISVFIAQSGHLEKLVFLDESTMIIQSKLFIYIYESKLSKCILIV